MPSIDPVKHQKTRNAFCSALFCAPTSTIAMSGVSTGIPYHIRSSAYSGGYLGLPRGESGQTLRLGTDITRDYDSHKVQG